MNTPKKQPVQIRTGSDKLAAIRSPPQPVEISSHTGVARSVSSWIRMTKIDMEGGRSGESEYVHAEREQTKVQLHTITKRLCEVIENFDGGRSRVTEDEKHEEHDAIMQVSSRLFTNHDSMSTDHQEREDTATLIADYGKLCVERNKTLESLDDWFKEGHIDDLEDMWEKMKLLSNGDDYYILRQSLVVGKLAALRLKAVYAELEKGAKQASSVSKNLKAEMQKLEKEVQASKETIETIVDKKDAVDKERVSNAKSVSDMVKETWKYAAAEICDMLNRVKDHAGDTKALETKINKMVTSMNQQSDTVNQLNKKIKELEEVIIARLIRARDQVTTSLTDDNAQLKEGMDSLRGEVLKAKKQAAVLQTQLEQTEQEKDAAVKKTASGKPEAVNESLDSASNETLKALVSDLAKKNSKLEHVTVKKLEEERDQLKAEIEILNKTSPGPTESKSPSSRLSGSRASNERVYSNQRNTARSPPSHLSTPVTDIIAQVENNEVISQEKMKELVEEVHKKMLANEQLEQLASDAENKLKEAEEKVQILQNTVIHLQEQLEMGIDKNQSAMECQVSATPESNAHFETEVTDVEQPKEQIEGKTLEMVADLLKKLNSDEYPFEIADSKALRALQEEAIKVNQMIESFMAYSSDVLNQETVVMSNAVEKLLSQLPPSEREEILIRSKVNESGPESAFDYIPTTHTPPGSISPGHILLHRAEHQETVITPTLDNNPFNSFLSGILNNKLSPSMQPQASPLRSGAESAHRSDTALFHAFDGIVNNILYKSADTAQQSESLKPVLKPPSSSSTSSVQCSERMLADFGADVLSPKLKFQHNKLKSVLTAMAQHKKNKGPGYKFSEVTIPKNMTELLQVHNYGGQAQQLQTANKLHNQDQRRNALQGLQRKKKPPFQTLIDKANKVHYVKDQTQTVPLLQVQKQEEKGVSITKFNLMSNTYSLPASSPWVAMLDNGSSSQKTRRLPAPLQRLQERQKCSPPQPSTSKPGTWLQSMAVPNTNKEMALNVNQSIVNQTLMRSERGKISAETPPSSPRHIETLEMRGEILINDLPVSMPAKKHGKVSRKSLFWSRRRHMQSVDGKRKRKAPAPGSVMYKIPPDYVDIY
eukprot:Em0021g514a